MGTATDGLGAGEVATRVPVARGSAATAPFDVTAAPRAVLRESVRLLSRVLGERRMGDAAANARAAVRADQLRAAARDEVNRQMEAVRRTR